MSISLSLITWDLTTISRYRMKILVTGACGFVGKNLCQALACIRDGKDRTRSIKIEEIYEYDLNTPKEYLMEYCKGLL